MGGGPTPAGEVAEYLREGKEQALALLRQAARGLKEAVDDADDAPQFSAASALGASESVLFQPAPAERVRKVFIVHGREEGTREAVARFLEKIGFEAIILNEQANRNRTIIEKIEAHNDVGFAVVLMTPDDEGALKGEPLAPRVRQNVLLELGYFIGHLGREYVCALKVDDVDIPSDFAGVLWTPYDANWKTQLAKELKAAGFTIDWNKVMA